MSTSQASNAYEPGSNKTPTSLLGRTTATALPESAAPMVRSEAGAERDDDSVVSWANSSRKDSVDLVAKPDIAGRLPTADELCKRNAYHAQRGQRWFDEIKADRAGRSASAATIKSQTSSNTVDMEACRQDSNVIQEKTGHLRPPTPDLPSPLPPVPLRAKRQRRADPPFVPGELVLLPRDRFLNACHLKSQGRSNGPAVRHEQNKGKLMSARIRQFLTPSP